MVVEHANYPLHKKTSSNQSLGHKEASKRLQKKPTSTHRRHITIDEELDRWPFCIVWTPLPVVTWFVPLIGHTGVANSKGIIYDFSDDFDVSVDNFAFGSPTKYYQYHESLIKHGAEGWDKAIQETADYYSRLRHNFFFNNCHQYISDVLNKVNYDGRTDWTPAHVWFHITLKSQYTGCLGFLRHWWPFTVILIALIVFLTIAFT